MENTNPGSEIRLVKADKGKRIANYLIDGIGFYAIMIVFVVIYLTIDPYASIFEEDSTSLVDYVITYLIYVAFYTGFEATLGQTPGKLITKTKVVTEYGEKPSTATIIGRSFARLIPFEAFSFLGASLSGWHDNLSKTMVIDLKASVLPTEDYWDDEVIDANL